jgi:hypothetical protein
MEARRVVRRRDSHIFSRKSGHRWRWGYQPFEPDGRALPPGRFLVLISLRGWADLRAIVRVERIRLIEKSSYLIGNRTSAFPACSIVPQPTSLPRTPCDIHFVYKENQRNKAAAYGHNMLFAFISLTPANRYFRSELHLLVFSNFEIKCPYRPRLILPGSPCRPVGFINSIEFPWEIVVVLSSSLWTIVLHVWNLEETLL